MDKNDVVKFQKLHEAYYNLFNSEFDVYNDNSGVIRANINMGPAMPMPQIRELPFYNQSNLCLLQEADQLEKLGVFAKLEDIGINVKYASPSFLVKRSQGDIIL